MEAEEQERKEAKEREQATLQKRALTFRECGWTYPEIADRQNLPSSVEAEELVFQDMKAAADNAIKPLGYGEGGGLLV